MKSVLSRVDRIILFLLLAGCLLGFALAGHMLRQAPAQTSVSTVSSHSFGPPLNGGPGHQTGNTSAAIPNLCNPFDISCIENSAASWLAQGITGALNPVLDWIAHDPADILYNTSDQLTYNNPQVLQLSSWVGTIVDSALVIFVILAGYNILRGVTSHYENMRALPALAVAAIAAHFAINLAGPIIEISNGICDYLRHQTVLFFFTSFFQNILSLDPISAGWLALTLWITLVALGLALTSQMIIRIALIDLMLIFMPVWVICFGLPQAEFVARPIARAFFVTIFIQAIQVAVLGLASLFLDAASTGSAFSSAPWMGLIVGIAIFYLVLRLPNMLGASLVLREAADAAVNAPRRAAQDAYMLIKMAALLA